MSRDVCLESHDPMCLLPPKGLIVLIPGTVAHHTGKHWKDAISERNIKEPVWWAYLPEETVDDN